MKYGMIPVFIPHVGCPHICVFCNQHRIANSPQVPTGKTVQAMIEDYIPHNSANKTWEVAFYGGTFTAVDEGLQRELLEPAKEALDRGIIDRIRCSTRPDDVSDSQLALLKEYGVTTVELGVQSLDNHILERAKRGHSAEDVEVAVKQLRKHHFQVGLQLILGLPGETWKTVVETTVRSARLQPDFVRIYPLLVVEDTDLADDFRQGLYRPLTMDEAITYTSFMKSYFEERHIEVIRTGLQATEEFDKGTSLLGGPYSPSFGEEVINKQVLQRICYAIYTLEEIYGKDRPLSIEIAYSRPITSKVRGLRNRNKAYVEDHYNHRFIWIEDGFIDSKKVHIYCGSTRITFKVP